VSIEDDVRAVAAAWGAALVRNDATVIATFMTDDWVKIGATGPATKRDIIEWIASGRLAHHTMTVVGGERVARVGDTVVITAHKVSSGNWDGAPYAADEWISEIYIRAGTTWRCAFSQATEAVDEPPGAATSDLLAGAH
jgi:ketosteroid isomerase-like protein